MFPAEVVAICSLIARAGGPEDEQVQSMADRIVQYAQACMRDGKRASPFERKSFHFSGSLDMMGYSIGDAAREGMLYRGGVGSL